MSHDYLGQDEYLDKTRQSPAGTQLESVEEDKFVPTSRNYDEDKYLTFRCQLFNANGKIVFWWESTCERCTKLELIDRIENYLDKLAHSKEVLDAHARNFIIAKYKFWLVKGKFLPSSKEDK